MTTYDKSRLPSRHTTEGPARAPHRSYYYAMGISEEEIKQPLEQPLFNDVGHGTVRGKNEGRGRGSGKIAGDDVLEGAEFQQVHDFKTIEVLF